MGEPSLTQTSPRAAVVLCLSPTGLTVARALSAMGAPVYGADLDPFEIGHYSSLIHRYSSFSRQRTSHGLLDALIAFSRSCKDPPVLFTAGDEQIEWVAEHHTQLIKHFLLQDCARPDVASRFVDKRTFYEWVKRTGVELPRTHFPEREEQVREIAHQLQYPVILKPARGHAWRRHLKGAKVIEAIDADALLLEYNKQARFDSALVIQEVIPGPESAIVVAACAIGKDGRPLSIFTARKARQYPYYFGSACYCVSEWVPEVADLSLGLLAKLNFRGVCGTEFKLDPRSGKWALIEINPRPTLWFDLARVSGVNPIGAIYRDLMGSPPLKQERQLDGVTWRYLVRDWLACMKYWLRGDPEAPSATSALTWPDSEAIFSARDLSASIAYPFYVFTHAVRHLIR